VDNCPVLRQSVTQQHTDRLPADQCHHQLSAHSVIATTAATAAESLTAAVYQMKASELIAEDSLTLTFA